MGKVKVDVIEIIREGLTNKEKEVNDRVKRSFPECGPIKLYRASDGRVGFEVQMAIRAGGRKRLDQMYQAVMKALGEKRGRPRGGETVQTKLHLPKPVHAELKRLAEASGTTMSTIVADSLKERLLTKQS